MRIGSIGYASNQGIAMLMKQFYDNRIVTDVMVFRHGSRPSHMEWYPEGTRELVGRPFNGPEVGKFLTSVDAMLFFETPFDWQVLDLCKKLGTKTVLVPMYECTPERLPFAPDKFICPSLLDVEYFPTSKFLQIPVDPTTWQQRTRAMKFLHNGGNLGLRGHKGTLELLQAMQYVRSDLTLHVRAQDINGLKNLIKSVRGIESNNRVTFEYGDLPYENLFNGYDVLVQPERYNGLSLPLNEARANGMLVMTSNRFPHNSWLPVEPLIPVKSYSKQRVGGSYNEYDEALLDPKDIAQTMDNWYGQSIVGYSYSGKEWAEANSWGNLRDKWIEEILR